MISTYYLITDHPCRFYVSWSLIDRLPQTRLGRLRRARNTQDILELCDKFNIEDNEYYFDRHPRNFGAVINFYRTGKLHLGEEGCPVAFKQDLDYWGIDELYLEPCCQQRYYQARELIGIDRIERVIMTGHDMTDGSSLLLQTEDPEYFRPGTLGRIQKCLWDLFEKPHTSLGARVTIQYTVLSCCEGEMLSFRLSLSSPSHSSSSVPWSSPSTHSHISR